ncbi:hypothetical protein [Mycobacterium sp. HNNTM2301]|uniref:hypothetical protein n=1 Tax=Mycobacterium hainanense TaxID=3289775 RepID=UPI0035A70393
MSGHLLGRGFPNNALLRARPIRLVPVTFDAAGGGNNGAANPLSWSETITGNAVLVLGSVLSNTLTGITATVGSASMNQLPGSPFYVGSNLYLFAFGLVNGPTGTQTIAVDFAGGVSNGSAADSLSYNNLAGFGTPVTNNAASGTAISVSAASAPLNMVAAVMSSAGSTASSISNFNQTIRYTHATVSGGSRATVIGDAPGAPTVTFTGTAPGSSAWGAMAVPLLRIL